MLFLLNGLIIGLVTGLTGAGGALVAVPLFMMFMGMPLKEASILSLISVILAASINFIPLRRNVQLKLSFILLGASLVGSLISAPIKEFLPDVVIASLLAIVSLYSLIVTWMPKKVSITKTVMEETEFYHQRKFILIMIVGFILGMLTTFTGLGGGVLLMPVLTSIFKLEEKKALPTSLITIFFSSLMSFILQIFMSKSFILPGLWSILFLTLGVVGAVLSLKKILIFLTPYQLQKARQIVFSAVVLLALSKIF